MAKKGAAPSTFGQWSVQKKIHGNHVFRVSNPAGHIAVLKTARGSRMKDRRRFWDEVRGSKRLTDEGVHGVLPVLDVDPADPPSWMVTTLATPLEDRLRSIGFPFREAVAVTATLAGILAELHARQPPLAHRDIKPGNLFWLANVPVVGDLGLSTWERSEPVTYVGEKVGPQFFIAPEAERYDLTPVQACRTDVFSLAKVMWYFCSGAGHPPQGPLAITDMEASLHAHGGESSRRLRYLIDRATAFRPFDRPTMAEFSTELGSWLIRFPPDHPDLKPLKRSKIIGGPAYVTWDQIRWSAEPIKQLRTRLREAARRIVKTIGNGASIVEDLESVKLLQDTSDVPSYRDPDWEPDGYEQVAIEVGDRRIVLASVLIGDEAHHLAEVQCDGELMAGSVSRTWGRFGCPTDDDALEYLETWASSEVAPEPTPGDDQSV